MKKLLIFILIIIISTSGCSKKIEDENQTAILLMHGWDGVGKDHVAMRNIFKDFEKENEEIRFVVNSCPYSDIIVEKANDMLAVDKMPDIIFTSGISSFLTYAKKKNKALDLMPYINNDEELRNNIHPQILNMWVEDGKIYTIPDVLEIIGYWYNEEIFRKAKITDDGTVNGEVVIPKTWEEFWNACDKIKDYNKENNTDIELFELNDYFSIGTFLGARVAGYDSYGTDFMNVIHPSNFNVEPFVNSIMDIKKLKKYNISILTGNINDSRYNFEMGNSAIYINGVWDSIQLEDCKIKDNIKYATFPGYDGNTISFVSASSGYVVSNDQSKDKIDTCIGFIKYMMSEKTQLRIALETKQASQNPNLDTDILQSKAPLLGKAMQVSNNAVIKLQSIETLWNIKVLKVISNNLKDVIEDNITVEEFVQEINRVTNK